MTSFRKKQIFRAASLCLAFTFFLSSGPSAASPGYVQAREGKLERDGERYFPLGINYYPRNKIWEDFWLQYDEAETGKDLVRIEALGFNSIRIFIHHPSVTNPFHQEKLLTNLHHFLNEASRRNILTIVTLFDWAQLYADPDERELREILEKIVMPLKDHPGILAWDIKNEPDLDYKFYRSPEIVNHWLEKVLGIVREMDPNHLITVGWLHVPPEAASLLQKCDFISFHHYGYERKVGKILKDLQKRYPGKPVVLEEYGYFTLPLIRNEEGQKAYLRTVMREALLEDVDGLFVWTLYDHAPFQGVERPLQENFFGILRQNYEPKKAAALFSAFDPESFKARTGFSFFPFSGNCSGIFGWATELAVSLNGVIRRDQR
ncbi:MAG TPA: cellulase family glycosylhydrolase [Candidatus Omnitrophota bacterium]|nr:cellulase family glycosylhydrolase [Candidatus Omnitrophota bacterium]